MVASEQVRAAAWFPSLEYNYVKLKNFRLWETQDSKKLKIVLNFQDCLVVSNFIPTFANEYETRKGKKPESSFENGRKQTRHDQYVAGKLRKVSS